MKNKVSIFRKNKQQKKIKQNPDDFEQNLNSKF